jgi:pyridoxal phosphate enzyme (YggS family)
VTIADRVALVHERIKVAGGRDITLVAASKGATAAQIAEAHAAGVRCFGENYLQEALAKMPCCPSDIEWHFIGRLQSNKVKKVGALFGTVQTVDSVEKALKLSSSVPETRDAFLEVNVADEQQKAGISPRNVQETAEIVYALPNLRLIGLMTMGPENPIVEETRPFFIRMRKLIESLGLEGVDKLSMGMTADYEVAIQEGATHIRVGSGLFGPRINR